VPAVLQGGNHAAIRRWRLKQAVGRSWTRRPDLLDAGTVLGRALSDEERALLDEFLAEREVEKNG
jgi:tRNA (guanine37-N1)-methyltransferase